MKCLYIRYTNVHKKLQCLKENSVLKLKFEKIISNLGELLKIMIRINSGMNRDLTYKIFHA